MHVIRLHGPWTLEVAGQPPRRVHLPRDWSQVGEAARERAICLIRRFHRPTGLTGRTRVTLALPGGWPVSMLTVEGTDIPGIVGGGEKQTFDVSNEIHLRESHELRIELGVSESLSTQPYGVAIEIVEPESA